MKSSRSIGQIVRRAFSDLWRTAAPPGAAPRNRADLLVKMNLVPVFGRRDAAYDRAAELIKSELFSLPVAERQKIFLNIKRLLRRVEQDTRKVLTILSNPDTVSRETALLNFVLLLDYGADALESFVVFSSHLQELQGDVQHFSPLRSGDEMASREEELEATEISLVNQLREFFDRVEPRVSRYREYAAKSFSRSFAARYANSYGFYIRAFRGEDPTADAAELEPKQP